jgi:hypothetical protein
MKIGDLVKWRSSSTQRLEIGIVVSLGQLNHLSSRKLPNGAYVHWPRLGLYWSPISHLEVISEAR